MGIAPKDALPAQPVSPPEISLGRRVFRPRTAISFVVGIAILAFGITRLHINVAGTVHVMGSANWRMLVGALLVYYTTFPIRSVRWRRMLQNVGYRRQDIPSIPGLAEIIYLSWFANSVVPAKLGDVYRAYLLRERSVVSMMAAGGTIVAERLIDLSTMLVIMGAAGVLSFRGRLPGPILTILEVGFAAVILAGLVLLNVRRFDGLVRKVIPGRFHGMYEHFRHGTLNSFGHYDQLVSLSILAWCAEVGRLFLVTQAVGLTLSPNIVMNLLMVAFIALGAALLTAPPGTPAGLGYVEATMTYVLVLLGAGRSVAISVALLDRAISVGSIIVFGFIVYLLSHRHEGVRAHSPRVAQR